jgi:hypothetical protein
LAIRSKGAALLNFLFFMGHTIFEMCTITDAAWEPTNTGPLAGPMIHPVI